jgi:hypothetical protein
MAESRVEPERGKPEIKWNCCNPFTLVISPFVGQSVVYEWGFD